MRTVEIVDEINGFELDTFKKTASESKSTDFGLAYI